MVEFYRSIGEILFTLLDAVPMPFRPMVLVVGISVILHGLMRLFLVPVISTVLRFVDFFVYTVVSILILPEYWLFRNRRNDVNPPAILFLYGDLCAWTAKTVHMLQEGGSSLLAKLRMSWRWVFLLLLIIGGLWVLQDVAASTVVGTYIRRGFAFYNALENHWREEAISNSLIPSSSATSPTRTASPSQSTATPTPIPTRVPSPTVSVTATDLITYTVQSGDSLDKIARRFGISIENLIARNQERYPGLISDPRRISVGWILEIPIVEQ